MIFRFYGIFSKRKDNKSVVKSRVKSVQINCNSFRPGSGGGAGFATEGALECSGDGRHGSSFPAVGRSSFRETACRAHLRATAEGFSELLSFGTKPAEDGIFRCGPPPGIGFGPPGSKSRNCKQKIKTIAASRKAAARRLHGSPIHWKQIDSYRASGAIFFENRSFFGTKPAEDGIFRYGPPPGGGFGPPAPRAANTGKGRKQ